MDWFFVAATLLLSSDFNVAQTVDIRCYACTSIDANAMLTEITDPNWLRWLENVRYVPFSQFCKDDFQVDMALRDGVRSHECTNGVCMKMAFQERNGVNHVWRNCIPQAKDQIRSDCTRISSGEGSLEVCTCDGNLCNGTSSRTNAIVLIFSLLLAYFFI